MATLKKTRSSSLFIRIAFSICIPLFILGLIFSAIQLTNQIQTMNELQKIQSQTALQEIYKNLSNDLLSYQNGKQTKEKVKSKTEYLERTFSINSIALYNLKESRDFLTEQNGAWSQEDLLSIQEGMAHWEQGKTFYIITKPQKRQLIAYAPINLKNNIIILKIKINLINVKEALKKSKWQLLASLFLFTVTGIIIGNILAFSIIRPIKLLNKATQEIMRGNLGKHVEIHTGDEIENLARTFNRMSDQLKEMKTQAMDSNPLTLLPGNQGIFQEISRRITEGHKFVLFHIDIDRFKIYNDHFGLGRGDIAIKKTVEILKKAIREKGTIADFIGHQGGDDFVVITKPNHATSVAEYVCAHFDTEVLSSLYPKEDFERGYTMQIDRRRLAETGTEVLAKFPLIAISLAGVSNAKLAFADYFDCMAKATQVKKEVKKTPTSSFIILE